MRQILFRGKRLDTGEWAEGNYVIGHEDNIEHHYIMPWSPQLQNWPMFEVDPDTVGQFTGLKDKDGKKIFEGDIIKKEYGSSVPTFSVAWDNNRGMFIQNDGYNEPLYQLGPHHRTVIGNIHDNENLIK